MYINCEEGLFLGLCFYDREHEFEIIWNKLKNDERTFLHKGNIICKEDRFAPEIESEYGIKLFNMEDDEFIC